LGAPSPASHASHCIGSGIGAARAAIEQECAAAPPKGAPAQRRCGGVRRHAVRWLPTLALALAACAKPQGPQWPSGLLLSADRSALAAFLDSLSQLEGTPLARVAVEWRSALPACPQVEAYAPDADPRALLASLRCANPQGPLAVFHAARGEHALALAFPGDGDARATAFADLDAGSARATLRWPGLDGRLADLLPGDAPAGPDRLAVADRVAHGRARSAGPLDLAAWVPSGSQGDRLFHLRDRVLSAALLDGTLELALYPPDPGAAMPRAAAALGVRQADAARAAAERFLDEVGAMWRLRRAPFSAEAGTGSCLPDLHLLPELAPCYALARDALVFGWNEASLRHALESPLAPQSAPDAERAGDAALPARFDLDLARLRAADLALAAKLGREPAALRWPWRSVRATAGRESGALRVELALVPERAS
jgi:hypothetical protein